MSYSTVTLFDEPRERLRLSRRGGLDAVFGICILGLAGIIGAAMTAGPSSDRPTPHLVRENPYGGLERAREAFSQSATVSYSISLLDPHPQIALASPAPEPLPPPDAEAQTTTPVPPQRPIALPQSVPLPPANPFRGADRQKPTETPPAPVRAANRKPAAGPQVANATPAEDHRSFFEKLFNPPSKPAAPGPALAYARPDDGGVTTLPAFRAPSSPSALGAQTAVYDIEAHVVYMPDGSTLEAHSGLGDMLDDPSHIHVKNRGATPPHVYDLTMREQLFHGVRALRLTPANSRNMFNRDGLLAHSFMLGPRGDSNGCVSFRNYPAFLNAFVRGEVKRLVVVSRGGVSQARAMLASLN